MDRLVPWVFTPHFEEVFPRKLLCLCACDYYLFRCISDGRCSPQCSLQDEGLISALLLLLSQQNDIRASLIQIVCSACVKLITC